MRMFHEAQSSSLKTRCCFPTSQTRPQNHKQVSLYYITLH